MPGMDGLAFVNAIRERPSISWTPIVLLTARAGDEARVEGLLSGADDYIAKPFKSKELIARVHLHLHIGKRKQELQKLFDQRTREIKLLSDMSPVGIFRTDNQGQITYTNKRWHEITDYPPNQPFTDWILNVHPVFQKDVLNATTQVLHNNEGANLEIQWRNEKWTKLQIERVANGLIGTVTDISDRRLYEAAQIAQAKEREALAQLRAADAEQQRAEADERRRAQELLVDVTSHELRQPVSAIINCSQMVRTNLGNLADMLREARASSFRPTEALLAVIEEDLTNELRMKRIKLDIKLGDSVYVLDVKRVSSDRTRFSQIVTNLMSNAIKFTDISPAADRHIVLYLDLSLDPPAGDKCIAPAIDIVDLATIRRKVKTPGTVVYVYVAVQDAGPGLKPGDLSLLFQRFQQGSNSHEVFGGSGLGLFVSRKLCELMGGNIDVDSVYGQGATFRFFIQVKTGREIPNEAESATTSSVPSHVAPPTVPMGPVGPSSQTAYHILITEDNIINQTVLNRQLKYAGFTTELANNGKEALERVKKLALGTDNIDPALPRRFDAILMDCEMPVMDGNTATKEIRRLEKEGILPLRNRIIALTGNAREGQVEAALNAGMDDVVIKPYKIDELVFKIRDRATMD
ncbi:hypothetical protein FRB99_005659 [Tulasnella sp. 403]|nr:hypothetical protein FRB99_005659 [Tulasnella sp. 403]